MAVGGRRRGGPVFFPGSFGGGSLVVDLAAVAAVSVAAVEVPAAAAEQAEDGNVE